MHIMKSSVMQAIMTSNEYNATIKLITPDVLDVIRNIYGEEAVRKLRTSELYEEDSYDKELLLRQCNLSANIFEYMPGVITEEELPGIISAYMKENGMWPTVRPVQELARYSLDVALPLFVKAGLLETTY